VTQSRLEIGSEFFRRPLIVSAVANVVLIDICVARTVYLLRYEPPPTMPRAAMHWKFV